MRDFKRVGEVGWQQESKERRARNRQASLDHLNAAGVVFTEHNNGAHLIIRHGGFTVDFWPGTGKWAVRRGLSGRGVFNLLAALGIKKD